MNNCVVGSGQRICETKNATFVEKTLNLRIISIFWKDEEYEENMFNKPQRVGFQREEGDRQCWQRVMNNIGSMKQVIYHRVHIV